MITVSISGIDGVTKQLARIEPQSKAAIRQLAQRIHDLGEAGADKHTKTGALFRSIYLRSLPGDGWEIGHDLQRAPHAVFVHWGTKPHVIRPKNRKALRWAAGGIFHFAKKVHHPGYKGDPWLPRAADQALREFPKMIADKLNRI